MSRFTKVAWGFVAYLIGVILFGAWVRITGSGAGCGSHWPTCHGEIVPTDPTIGTIIEYTHRLTSGLCGIFGLIIIVWAVVRYGTRHRVFWAAVATMAFVIFEALIGAGLVLKELVENDDSVARAVIISLHLVNTLILTGAASLTAWWSQREKRMNWSAAGPLKWLLLGGLLAIVATSMSGAVTALGDTLFPPDHKLGPELFSSLQADMSAANHFLVRLRILHPIIASVTAVYLLMLGDRVRDKGMGQEARRWAGWLMWAVVAEVLVGISNIALAAPGWLQLGHLLVAQVVWVCALLMAHNALCVQPGVKPDPSPERGEQPAS